MKRIVFLSALIMLFVSCNKNHECRYDEQYDSSTKKCECLSESEMFICKTEGEYESVGQVHSKYAQRIKNPSEYKFYSHAGDTVKFCGYFYTAISQTDTITHTDHMSHYDKIPIGGSNYSVNVDIDEAVFDTLNIRKKCFATGILQFPANVEPSKQCFTMPFYFKIIDIHN